MDLEAALPHAISELRDPDETQAQQLSQEPLGIGAIGSSESRNKDEFAVPVAATRSIAPLYGPKAELPPVPTYIAEQVEASDGTRAIEVAALFEDAVLEVRYLENPLSGQVSRLTRGILYGSAVAAALGILLILLDYGLLAKNKAAIETWQKHAAVKIASGEKYYPPYPPQAARRNADLGAASFSLASLVLLLWAFYRHRNELSDPTVSIGPHPRATFKVPGDELPVTWFPLVRARGRVYELLFTTRMTGEMHHDDKTVELTELRRSGQALPAEGIPDAFAMAVPPEARVNIHLGKSTFSIHSVAKPRAYPMPFRIGRVTKACIGGGALVFGLFLALVHLVPPTPKSLTLDEFLKNPRWTRFLVSSKDAHSQDILDGRKAEVPKSCGKDCTKQRPSEVVPKNLFENNLPKFGNGDDIYGSGVLKQSYPVDSVSDAGKFPADRISVCTVGRGPERPKETGPPEIIPGTANVLGPIDKDLIRRVIRLHINEVMLCYESALARQADLGGRIMINFSILPTGQVADSAVEHTTVGDPPLEQCVVKALRHWTFPKHQTRRVVVIYPFVMKPHSL